jgi:hypothetical protein
MRHLALRPRLQFGNDGGTVRAAAEAQHGEENEMLEFAE